MKNTAGVSQKGGRKSASLPPKTVEYLKAWMMSPEHVAHPYPTEQEKAQIMAETGIELKQLTNWFVNNRKRYWRPRVEAKLQKKNASAGSLHSSLLQGNGGMSLPLNLNHVDHKLTQQVQQQHQGAANASHPMLLNPSMMPVPFFSQGNGTTFGPMTGGAIQVQAAVSHLYDDTHTISEGSGSSVCNSDEDSTSTFSASRRSSMSTSCAQYTRLTSSGIGSSSFPLSCNYSEVDAKASQPPMNTIHVVSPLRSKVAPTTQTSSLTRSRDSMKCAGTNQDGINSNLPPKKRARTTSSTPSLKGEEEWKKLCQHASSLYCESLPDLDEAAAMFGYAS